MKELKLTNFSTNLVSTPKSKLLKSAISLFFDAFIDLFMLLKAFHEKLPIFFANIRV
jgi:hypothetical protein